jgi:hypothetical protein
MATGSAEHQHTFPVDTEGYFTTDQGGRAVKLITDPHLAPRLRISAASLTRVFMAWCLTL